MSAPAEISASEAKAEAWHGVITASLLHDLPQVPPPSVGEIRGRLAHPGLDSVLRCWQARGADGEVAAVAGVRLFTSPGMEDVAELALHVRPADRDRGLGGALLAAAAGACRDGGRRTLLCAVPAGTAAEAFFLRHGFKQVLTVRHLVLAMDGVHRAWLEELVGAGRDGYELVRWRGTVPDRHAAALARAKAAMADMPLGELDLGTQGWSAARVREMAEVIARRGDVLLTAAAVHGAEIAGYTEVVIPGGSQPRARQYDTAVVPAHRGHGLGVWVKAEMLRWLHDAYPGVREVEADNAEQNGPMLAVNEQLGLRHERDTHEYQLRL
ncbi:GNAT family N-acetyltransferase [Streptomyces sp. NPDC051940]|uniref:GNAT family N-acetyltransferase n=1 Tax=Streptomyces sp. NPDC051940 TaxID=3155675 RepID=UPI003426A053